MILSLDDWQFEIDLEQTMARSAAEASEHCTCAYCRNFYAEADHACSKLRPMLAQFGLDLEAPDTLYPYDISNDRMCYEGKYVVFGRIIRYGRHSIDCQGADLLPMEDDESLVQEPYFVLSLEGLALPWVLDEPMREVISPANEPGFLKKMWQRLLMRMKPQDTIS